MSIKSVKSFNHLILCPAFLLPLSIFPSIRVFSNRSDLLVRWWKYWNFSFSISPSNEYSGLISFRMDGLDLLAVQGTLKSLLQHHSSKASILGGSAFFIVQPPHPYITTGIAIALTQFSSLQSLSPVWLFATPWTAACQVSLSITNSWSLLKLMSVESVMTPNHLILCHIFSSCLQSFPASGSFQMSQLLTSGGQSIGVSASTSVLPMNIQDW